MEARRKRILLRIVAAAASVAIGCPMVVHLGRLYLPRLWGNLHIVNFIVAWLPAVFSILVAFIPDKDLGARMRFTWRAILIFCGVLYSVFLWHQQDLNDQATAAQTQGAVTAAVQQANAHSDTKFDQVQKQVNGLGQDLTQTASTIGKQLTQMGSDIDSNIGKVGKPDPPERPRLRFSLWKQDIRDDEFPLESIDVTPDSDGNLTIPFLVRNDSGVQAEGVEIWVYICDVCSFAKEPTGFDRPEGMGERARHRSIPAMNPGVMLREHNTISVKVNQTGMAYTQVVFRSTCKTCGSPQTSEQFVIRINLLPIIQPAISN